MPASYRIRLTCIACAAVALLSSALHAQPAATDEDAVALAIESELDRLMDPEVTAVHGEHVALREPVQSFYAERKFRAAWSNERNASQLLRALAESYDEGLDPKDYHYSVLEELTRRVGESEATNAERAQYDVLLTDALLRLAYHLSFGKVDPETFDPQWNYGRTLASRDVTQEIEEALAAEDIYERIDALKPTQPLYVELKRELARYRAVASDNWPRIPGGTVLKPEMSDSRVPMLRARLIASGDLPAAENGDSEHYDASVVSAVRAFQRRMGLEDDGALGPGTIEELNVAPADRIRQLRVNLDRGRVLLHDLPAEYVVVNIAGFQIYYIREHKIV